MTDQYESGRGVDVVAGGDDVSADDVTTTAPDPGAVEGIVGEAVTPTSTSVPGNGSPSGSTVETVKDQSAQVGHQAADTGQRVASVAKDEAQAVVSEASDKARDLLGETTTQLRNQLSSQQSALATMLRSLADELHAMVEQSTSADASAGGGETGSQPSTNGLAHQAVREASSRASDVASWLEQREPGDVADEVTRFARRRPGLFLALAGAAGLFAGRFTRGLTGAGQDHGTMASKPTTQADARPDDSTAGTRYPSAAGPFPVVDTDPGSTPTGVNASEVIGGGAESPMGITHG